MTKMPLRVRKGETYPVRVRKGKYAPHC